MKLPKYQNLDTEKNQILSANKGKSGIYMFENKINGKRYIGSSEDLSFENKINGKTLTKYYRVRGQVIILLLNVVYFLRVYYITKIDCIVVGMYYKSIILLISLIVNNFSYWVI